MAIRTAGQFHQMLAARYRRLHVRFVYRLRERLRNRYDQTIDWKVDHGLWDNISDWRNRPYVNDDGGEIFIRKVAKVSIRHDRKQGSTIASSTFANSTRDLIVRSIPDPGLFIGN